MSNLLLCFHAIMPLLLLMLLGYFLKRIDFIPKAGFDAIDKLCFKIFVPVMLFNNVYTADFSQAFNLQAVIFMELAIIGTFLISFFLTPKLMPGSKENIATVVHGLCHGNLAVLGVPLITNLFGESGMVVYSIMLACTSPIINPLMVYEHIYFQGDKIKPRQLILNVLKSPFLIGTLSGLACKLLGIEFPTFLRTAITNVKSIASPLCLIALGGSFSFGSIRGIVGPVVHTVLAKCVWIPMIVLGIAVALGFRGIILASLMVIFCCPSAAATYSFCIGYCGSPQLASQIVVYSTAFSIVSMFLWLFAFLQSGLL